MIGEDFENSNEIGVSNADVQTGLALQCEISSERHKGKSKKVYDFVGKELSWIFENEEYIPEEPIEAENLIFVVAGKLKYFENRDEITEYIEDLGAMVSGSVSKKQVI